MRLLESNRNIFRIHNLSLDGQLSNGVPSGLTLTTAVAATPAPELFTENRPGATAWILMGNRRDRGAVAAQWEGISSET